MGYSEGAALFFSLFALGISTYLAIHQISLQKRANNVPALVEILSEYRSSSIHRSFEYVYQNLATHDPEAMPLR